MVTVYGMVPKITSGPAADATLSKLAVMRGGACGIGVDLCASYAGIAIGGGIDTPTPQASLPSSGQPPVLTF